MNRDGFGRKVDYLRLSITDRCNLRCVYCMPPEGIPLKAPSEILSYDELLRVSTLAVSIGIRKIRVTGGEPLVRGGVVDFVRTLRAIPGVEDLAMTTNGLRLVDLAKPLRDAGLTRVNISLDTLRRERYLEITRKDLLSEALAGIQAAVDAGFSPVKINVVLLHGLAPAELDDFVAMAREMPVEIRFIERMPTGCFSREGYVSADTVRAKIGSIPGAKAREGRGPSPAAVFDLPGFAGNLGVISPVSHKFCSDCNRLRVTADGRVRNCLFARETFDLKSLLRGGGADEEIVGVLREAIACKPEGHDMSGEGGGELAEPMSRVGG